MFSASDSKLYLNVLRNLIHCFLQIDKVWVWIPDQKMTMKLFYAWKNKNYAVHLAKFLCCSHLWCAAFNFTAKSSGQRIYLSQVAFFKVSDTLNSILYIVYGEKVAICLRFFILIFNTCRHLINWLYQDSHMYILQYWTLKSFWKVFFVLLERIWWPDDNERNK